MTSKNIKHVVMRHYEKHEDAITMSKEIAKSLSTISSVHQFYIRLNIGSKNNCNIVVFTEFENDEIYKVYSTDPKHKTLGKKVQSFGYPIGAESFNFYIDTYSNYQKNSTDQSIQCLNMYNWEDETTTTHIQKELLQIKDLQYVTNFHIHTTTMTSGNNKILVEYTIPSQIKLSKHKNDPKYNTIMKNLKDKNVKVSIIDYSS